MQNSKGFAMHTLALLPCHDSIATLRNILIQDTVNDKSSIRCISALSSIETLKSNDMKSPTLSVVLRKAIGDLGTLQSSCLGLQTYYTHTSFHPMQTAHGDGYGHHVRATAFKFSAITPAMNIPQSELLAMVALAGVHCPC